MNSSFSLASNGQLAERHKKKKKKTLAEKNSKHDSFYLSTTPEMVYLPSPFPSLSLPLAELGSE